MKKNGALGASPLTHEDTIMDRTFYRHRGRPTGVPSPVGPAPLPRTTLAPPKPTHYKIVSISLYTEDIERLDNLVGELKALGHTKANKSQLIRYALANVDIHKMPKGY